MKIFNQVYFLVLLFIAPFSFSQVYTLPHDHSSLAKGGSTLSAPNLSNVVEISSIYTEFEPGEGQYSDIDVVGDLVLGEYEINFSGGNTRLYNGVLSLGISSLSNSGLFSTDAMAVSTFGASNPLNIQRNTGNSVDICTTTDCAVSIGNSASTLNMNGILYVQDIDPLGGSESSITVGDVELFGNSISVLSAGDLLLNNNSGGDVDICHVTDCTISLGNSSSIINVNGSPVDLTGVLGSYSEATDGYFELGPFLIQWGITGVISDTGTDVEVFPQAFSAIYSISAVVQASAGAHFADVKNLTTTSVTFQHYDSDAGNSGSVRWMAIGAH